MKSKRVITSLSPQMLVRVDEAAKASFTTRSHFIRESIALRLNNQHVVNRPSQNEFMERLKDMADDDGDNLFDL